MRTKSNIAGKINFYLSGMPDVDSARPYDFLCEMEKYENYLLRLNNQMLAQVDYGDTVLEEMHNMKAAFPDHLLTELEEEQAALSRYYDGLVSWRDNLQKEKDIFLPHDTFPGTLERAISVAKDLFDQHETLRWAIMEHNVDECAKGKASKLSTAADVEDFFASL